jgi:hypothetical protein
MMTLKRTTLYFGLLVIAHFVITGLLLKGNFFLVEPQDILVRMMLRANHIYILFSGLVLLLVSYSIKSGSVVNYIHLVSSSILIMAAIGINVSFYIDPINHFGMTTQLIQRKLTGFSIIGFLIGTGLHLLLLKFYDRKSDKHPNH